MTFRILDLFCGAGGAAEGYHRAGFEVVGVDIKPQPHYPFEFHQGDALELLRHFVFEGQYRSRQFHAVHASPPCQAYSTATPDRSKHPDLYAPTRAALINSTLPYVIENVIGAPYHHGVVLCGTMFGLEADGEWIRRHRNFESSMMLIQPSHHHRRDRRAVTITGKCFLTVTKDCARHSRQSTFSTACKLMGIDWMDRKELPQAIPPAYTEFIGKQLLDALERGVAS